MASADDGSVSQWLPAPPHPALKASRSDLELKRQGDALPGAAELAVTASSLGLAELRRAGQGQEALDDVRRPLPPPRPRPLHDARIVVHAPRPKTRIAGTAKPAAPAACRWTTAHRAVDRRCAAEERMRSMISVFVMFGAVAVHQLRHQGLLLRYLWRPARRGTTAPSNCGPPWSVTSVPGPHARLRRCLHLADSAPAPRISGFHLHLQPPNLLRATTRPAILPSGYRVEAATTWSRSDSTSISSVLELPLSVSLAGDPVGTIGGASGHVGEVLPPERHVGYDGGVAGHQPQSSGHHANDRLQPM